MSAQSRTTATPEVVTTDLDQNILAKFNELAIIAHAKMATGNNERTRALPGLDSLPDLEGDNAEAMTGFLVEMGKSAVEFFRANPNGDFLAFRGWAKGKKQWSIKVEGMFNRYSPNKVETVLMARLPEFFETIRGDKRVLEAFNETAAQAAYESALAQYGAAARSGQLADQLPQLHLDFEKTAREQSEMMGYFWGNVAMLAGQFLAKKPQGNAQEFLKWTHKHGGKTGYNIAQAFGTQSKTPTGMFIRENLSDYFVAIREANAFFKGIDADISNKKEPEGILDKIGGFFTGMYDGFQQKSLGGKLFVVGMTVGFIYMAKELFSDGEGDGGGGLFSGMLGKMFGVSIAGAGLMSAVMGGPEKLAAYLKSNPEKRKEIMESGLLDLFFPGLGGKIEEGINFFSGENGDISVGAGLENGTDVLAEQIYMGLQGISGKVAEEMEAIGITGFEDPVPTRAEMNAYFNTTEGQQFLKENKELLLAGGGVALAVAGYALWKPAKFLGLLGSIATAPIGITKWLIGLNLGKIAFGTAAIAGVFLLLGAPTKAKAAELAEDFRQRHRSSLPPWLKDNFDKILTGDFDLHEALNATEANALQRSLDELGQLPPKAEKYRAEMLDDLAHRDKHGNSDTNLDDFPRLAWEMGIDPEGIEVEQKDGKFFFTLRDVNFGPLPENPFDIDLVDMLVDVFDNMDDAIDSTKNAINNLASIFTRRFTSEKTSQGVKDALESIQKRISSMDVKDELKKVMKQAMQTGGEGAAFLRENPVQFAALVAAPIMLFSMMRPGKMARSIFNTAFSRVGLFALLGFSVGAYNNASDAEKELIHGAAEDTLAWFQKHIANPIGRGLSHFSPTSRESIYPEFLLDVLRMTGMRIPDVFLEESEASGFLASLAKLREESFGDNKHLQEKITEIEAALKKHPPSFDSVLFRELAFRVHLAGGDIAVQGDVPPYTLIIGGTWKHGPTEGGKIFSPFLPAIGGTRQGSTIEGGIRFPGLMQNPMPDAEISKEALEQEMTEKTLAGLHAFQNDLENIRTSASTGDDADIVAGNIPAVEAALQNIIDAVTTGGHSAFSSEMQQKLFEACRAAGIKCDTSGVELEVGGLTIGIAADTSAERWRSAREVYEDGLWGAESLWGGTLDVAQEALGDSFDVLLALVPEDFDIYEKLLEARESPDLLSYASFWYEILPLSLEEGLIEWGIDLGTGLVVLYVGTQAFIVSAFAQSVIEPLKLALASLADMSVPSFNEVAHSLGGLFLITGGATAAVGAGIGVITRTGFKNGIKIGAKINAFPVTSLAGNASTMLFSPSSVGTRIAGLPHRIHARIPALRTPESFYRAHDYLVKERDFLEKKGKFSTLFVQRRKRQLTERLAALAARYKLVYGKGSKDAADELRDDAMRYSERDPLVAERARLQALRNEKAAYLRKKHDKFRDRLVMGADKKLQKINQQIADQEARIARLSQSGRGPSVSSKFREFFSSATPPGFVPANQAGFAGPRPDADTASAPEDHADADASKQRGGGFGAKAASSEQPASQSAAEPEPKSADAPDTKEPKPDTRQRPEVGESNVRIGKNAKAAVPSHWKAWAPPSASQVRRRIDGAESYEPNSINNQADAPAGRTPNTGSEQPSSAGNTPPIFEKISAPEPTNTSPDARTAPPKSDNPPLAVRNQQSIDTSDPVTDEQIREIYGKGSSSVSIPGTPPSPEAPAALVNEPEQQPKLTPQQKVDAEAESIIQEKGLNEKQASHLRRAARGLLHVMGPASVVLFLHEVSNAKDPREVFALDAVTFASGTAVSVGLAMTGLGLPVSIPAGIVTSLGVAFFGYDPIAKFFEKRRAQAGEQERGRQYQQDSQSMQNIVRIAPIEKLASSVFAGDTALAHFGETHLQRVGHMNGWGQFQVQEGIDASTLAHGLADTSGKAEIFTREASAETIAQWNKEIRQQIVEAQAKAAKLPKQLQHLANKQLSRAELYAKAKEHNIPLPAWGGPTGQSADAHPQFITIYNAYLAARHAAQLQAEIIDEQNAAFIKKYADQVIKLSMQVTQWEEDNQAKRRPEFFHAAGELIQAMRTLERIGMWTAVAKHIDTQYPQGTAQKMRDYARRLFAERRRYLQDMDRDLSSGLEADGA